MAGMLPYLFLSSQTNRTASSVISNLGGTWFFTTQLLAQWVVVAKFRLLALGSGQHHAANGVEDGRCE